MTVKTAEIGVNDRELKDKLRKLWSLGDYPRVAREIIPQLGHELAAACEIGPDQRVLDVAAGSGNAAFPAAMAGADVTATDLAPTLLSHGEEQARRRGIHNIAWQVADAEALPFAAASFDTVISSVGAMFAPRHQAVADELVRVGRPGGTIGLVNWTPAGFIGRMFAAMKPYAPPPPAGAKPPVLWGDESYVSDLLGDRVTDLQMTRRTLPVTRFESGAEFREYFKAYYGPTIGVYNALAQQPERATELDELLAGLGDAHLSDGAMDWEYLLVTAKRR